MTTKGTKKKLIDMDATHEDWIKHTAKELELYEKDVIFHVFDYAIKHSIMEGYRSRVVNSELQKTLNQLAQGVQDIASLKQKAEELLKQADNKQTQPD